MIDSNAQWDYSFDVEFHEDECRLGFRIKVQLMPDSPTAKAQVTSLMSPWKNALASQFNKWKLVSACATACNQCTKGIPMTFRVLFDDGYSVTEDQEVNVYDPQRDQSKLTNWYLQDQPGVPLSTLTNAPYRTPVHEMAHMFGIKDEYFDLVLYPTHVEPPDCNQSTMCNNYSPAANILQRHVEQVVDLSDVGGHLKCPPYTVAPR